MRGKGIGRMPAPSGGKPQRVSITLKHPKEDKEDALVVRTEKQTDGSYKTVVIHVHDDKRERGMTRLHETFAEAKERVDELAVEARRAGWTERKKSRVKPDAFDAIPKAR